MQMKRVFSSHIDAVGYDPESGELHVQFQGRKSGAGKIAVYSDVPPDVGNMVVNSPSVGSALHDFVRGKYAHGYKQS